MICKYRVTLDGIKGFYRLYHISSESSLYRFHKQLRADLEFMVDQPFLFKAFDESGAVVARYALIDIGYGSVDNVTIAQTLKAGVVKFVYFYDVASKKSVTITFEGEEPGTVASPVIVDTKGPLPIEFENGYVAFEDLPADKRRLPGERGDEDEDEDDEDLEDEDDEDLDDEDKDEEEVIYDENED